MNEHLIKAGLINFYTGNGSTLNREWLSSTFKIITSIESGGNARRDMADFLRGVGQ